MKKYPSLFTILLLSFFWAPVFIYFRSDLNISIIFLFLAGPLTLACAWEYWTMWKPKRCSKCYKKSQDFVYLNHKLERYCREHAVTRFEEIFTSFPHQMIVFTPEFERKEYGSMYPYFPIIELENKYNFPKGSKEKMEMILRKINGQCSSCNAQAATVAYYPQGILTWHKNGPELEKVVAKHEQLCAKCAFHKIESLLRHNPHTYNLNGLYLPYQGPGVFVNTGVQLLDITP